MDDDQTTAELLAEYAAGTPVSMSSTRPKVRFESDLSAIRVLAGAVSTLRISANTVSHTQIALPRNTKIKVS